MQFGSFLIDRAPVAPALAFAGLRFDDLVSAIRTDAFLIDAVMLAKDEALPPPIELMRIGMNLCDERPQFRRRDVLNFPLRRELLER